MKKLDAFPNVIPIRSFYDDRTFVTNDLSAGTVLKLRGCDDECLTDASRQSIASNLISAFRFDENYRLYQYLIRRNNVELPRKRPYANEFAADLIDRRNEYLRQRAQFGTLESYLVILRKATYEGMPFFRKLSVLADFDSAASRLKADVDNFAFQNRDLLAPVILDKQEQFRFFRYLANLEYPLAKAGTLRRDCHVNRQLSQSTVDWCTDGSLLVNKRHAVRVLSLLELPAMPIDVEVEGKTYEIEVSVPNMMRHLLTIESDFILCSEWRPEKMTSFKKHVLNKKGHLIDFAKYRIKDIAINTFLSLEDKNNLDHRRDNSVDAELQDLGKSLQSYARGGHPGQFSMTLLLHGNNVDSLVRSEADVTRIFGAKGGAMFFDVYGGMESYLSILPGNSQFNHRQYWISNGNYADFSIGAYVPNQGSLVSSELEDEYLMSFETDTKTPFYLDPYVEKAFAIGVFGVRGAGKSVLCNELAAHAHTKFGGHLWFLDVGRSYEPLVRKLGGAAHRLTLDQQTYRVNPFALANTPDNRELLFTFISMLETQDGSTLTSDEQDYLRERIEAMYEYDDLEKRRLRTFVKIIAGDRLRDPLRKWVDDGPYAKFFDNVEDTLNLDQSRVTLFDIEGMEETHRDVLQPNLFWNLNMIRRIVQDRQNSDVFKLLVIDELWKYLNPFMEAWLREMLKTMRKHMLGTILATQSAGDMGEYRELIKDTCLMTMQLRNPDFPRDLYAEIFNYNERDLELIGDLKSREIYIRTPDYGKKVIFNADPHSYWLFTTSGRERKKRDQALEEHGIEAIDMLALQQI